ncbi:hypothetical protein EV356DRAFT_559827 [Viridothelium virens]|uniref:Uncharacterized protein n=1 Tax=Viridothelium virens TaxID=1048519 RepID=A0A6A6H6R7_VIRVR|nr:hypothetical protein EV356DRAFT_559827 [Viridothelium virens]
MPAQPSKIQSVAGRKCLHTVLDFEPSSHAAEVGYKQPSAVERIKSTSPTDSAPNKRTLDSRAIGTPSPASFPASLVLPGDELAFDPDYESQSLRSWIKEKDRNELTEPRNVIYVVAPPEIDPEIECARSWSSPQISKEEQSTTEAALLPKVEDIIAYLSAFYTGVIVKPPPTRYRFTAWEPSLSKRYPKARARDLPKYIGLTTASSTVRIRTRHSQPAPFPHQLHLDDLLDALIEDLPVDAYAILLLTAHDLYESNDDDFCMGRAYGGSRVAVVSMGRYAPELDEVQEVGEGLHWWPASHCAEFVGEAVMGGKAPAKKKVKRGVSKAVQEVTEGEESERKAKSPMEEAVAAYRMQYEEVKECDPEELREIWLSRVCRTASHELGHCFGMDHCVYYACNMQGTASLIEDGRQPPYLCPVDSAKLLYATGRAIKEHYEALLAFCDQHPKNALFVAFGAWLSGRMRELKE